MALKTPTRVDMPEKGIFPRQMGNTVYIYYTTRAYRNKKGKPTNDRVSIGKLDEATGKLIPNRNYYEVYKATSEPEVQSIKSYGVTYLVDKILWELKLDTVLKKKFPELANQIIAISEYMLCEGNIMYYYDDWSEGVYPYENTKLSSQQISRVFQSIDYKRRMEFFKTWIHARNPNEYIAYDVTSISSYSQGIDNLEYGYNRDSDNLPQVNMAMYYGEESRLPLYYNVYPGSITDKTHLATMLQDNDVIGCKKAKYILDRGFHSAENVEQLAKAGCRFVMGIPNSLKFSMQMIDKYRGEIVNRSECRLGKGLPYAKSTVVEEFGIRAKLHIYYSPSKAVAEEEQFYDRIEKDELALRDMTQAPSKSKRYDKHFQINRNEDKTFDFNRDQEKINQAISRLGFFLILETDFKSTSEEILNLYRRRDAIEKSFNELKNGLDMKRLQCQSDSTVEGKIFVAFFSLILRSFIQNRLKQFQQETGTSFAAVMKELNKIKLVFTADGKRMLTPITKKQRDILDLCGVSVDDIPAWLNPITNYSCMV